MSEIGYVKLEVPIKGRSTILDWDTFNQLYLHTEMILHEIHDKYNVPMNVLNTSMAYYKTICPEEIKKKKYIGAYNLYLERRGKMLQKTRAKTLNKDILISLAAQGMTEWGIAKELGVDAKCIRRNFRSYHLPRPSRRIFSLSQQEWIDLEILDQLFPGVMDAAYRGIDDPSFFFHTLYDVYVGIHKLLWTLQRLGGRYNYYRQRKKIPRDYISWRMNKQEIVLSEKLRELNILHIREYLWANEHGRKFAADFFFPNTNLLVEINGEVHTIGRIRSLDNEKTQLAEQLGMDRLVFSDKDIDQRLDWVVFIIQQKLSNL